MAFGLTTHEQSDSWFAAFADDVAGADGHAARVMRGTIPPGAALPLHSHADPETFLMESGTVEGLRMSAGTFRWIPVGPGDVSHVPGDEEHAWRNPSGPRPR